MAEQHELVDGKLFSLSNQSEVGRWAIDTSAGATLASDGIEC